MPNDFSVFISHRAEDRFLARLLKARLEYLSSLDGQRSVECFVCEEIPGGAEWRQWMIDNTAKADCLIFIHTNAEHNWTWCASEISQFDGYKRALKLMSKVLWFSVDSSPSFPMLAENEFYGIGEDEVRRFLEDLFVRPTFGAVPLRPKLNANHARDFNEAVKDLHAQFMQITRPEELFRLRLRIVFSDELSFRQKADTLKALPPSDRARGFLTDARLEADPATTTLLSGPDTADLDWEDLLSAQNRYDSGAWLDELTSYVANSFSDVDIASRRSREQVLSPIFRDLKLYQPVIARLEYLDNTPFSVVIIFVPMPPFSEDPRLMVAQNMPKDIVFLSILLRLARRFRWSFLEPLYNAVENLDDDFSAKRWDDLLQRYHECLENLDSILRQGNMRELETVGDIKSTINISDDALLKEMFKDWGTFQTRLAQAIEKKSPGDVRQTLEPWLKRNKDFMKQLLVETQGKVDKLRPLEAH
ncbi:toll/interleukin-1 receptor domain-containing protein [Bradyrhizobium sp. Pear77]|uniref:toll/interleukin-1 receptor domain-containing protein n=1 Tax=Bradyrhizobium altum TaxID=1571202 RepID=UPI001E36E35A|nr:toll/interleukin-1 receptor domain-containing protein [Bradyrhizobium altum]MCC8956760.1 toll/interleukin-1 receptor domain-containing protein [Bradyrhizobium altum]